MYFIKLPSGQYLNLALARRIELEDKPVKMAVIHWSNSDRSVHTEQDVKAISNNFLDFS